jgi:hypothetical protein
VRFAQGAVAAEPVARVRAEVAVGYAPVEYGGRTRATTTYTLSPMVGWWIGSHTRSLLLAYTPRLMLRRPNRVGVDRPLIMHGANADYAERLSRQVQLTSQLAWAYGETDYLSLEEALGPTQTTVPRVTLIKTTQVSGQVGLSQAYTPRNRREIGLGASRFQPKGVQARRVLSAQTSMNGSWTESYLMSRRDTGSLTLGGGYTRFSGGILRTRRRYVFESARAGWERRLSQEGSLAVGAGAYAVQMTGGVRSWFPAADASLTDSLGRVGELRVTGHASAATEATPDNVLGRLRPMLSLGAGATATSMEGWAVGLSVSGATAATLEPLEPGQSESVMSAAVPLSYELSQEFVLEAGARATALASHWAARHRHTTDTQAWLYVALTWSSPRHHGL